MSRRSHTTASSEDVNELRFYLVLPEYTLPNKIVRKSRRRKQQQVANEKHHCRYSSRRTRAALAFAHQDTAGPAWDRDEKDRHTNVRKGMAEGVPRGRGVYPAKQDHYDEASFGTPRILLKGSVRAQPFCHARGCTLLPGA